jgi:hypothetical protein
VTVRLCRALLGEVAVAVAEVLSSEDSHTKALSQELLGVLLYSALRRKDKRLPFSFEAILSDTTSRV